MPLGIVQGAGKEHPCDASVTIRQFDPRIGSGERKTVNEQWPTVELAHRFHGWHDLGWPIVTITVRKNDDDNSTHFRTRMRLHVSVLSSNKGYHKK